MTRQEPCPGKGGSLESESRADARDQAVDTSPLGSSAPPLFRQSAIDAAAGTQFGEPLETYWRGTRRFVVAAFVILGVLTALLFIIEYSPIHRVPAHIDVAGGLVRLAAPADGHVARIAVEEGAAVKRGDLLAVLNTDRLTARGDSTRDALQRGLALEFASINAEIAALQKETEALRTRTERVIAGLREERTALLADIRHGEQLLVSLRLQSAQIDTVAERGYYTKLQAAQKRDEVLAQESRLASARAALARVEREIQTEEAELQVSDTRLRGTIENRRRMIGELERRGAVADADAEQVIRSPEAGTVSGALIARGQSVSSGQVLFTIAPADEPLVVRLVVPPRAAGTVRPGMMVKLAFQAYPREKFGEFDARVERVNSTPSMPSDVPSVYALREPAYLAVATLVKSPLGPNGEDLVLKPGMLADALVPVERRRAIEWLFEPLIRGFNESAGRARPRPPADAKSN